MPETPAAASLAILEPASGRPRMWATPVGQALRVVAGDTGGRLALGFLLLLAAGALFAPWLAPFDPYAPQGLVEVRLDAPSARHWFGTDPASRDVFSRMLFGTRVSLSVAVLSAVLAAAVGLVYGSIAGFAGGAVDGVMMRVVDAFLSIPRTLFLLVVIALWGRVSAPGFILLMGLTGWFPVSRLARAEAMALRSREFVVAARALGAGRWRVLVRHVLPHAAAPVLIAAAVTVSHVIVLEAGLSFLGVGIPQPNPTWGNIIHDGRETIGTSWWLTLFPGLALVGTALAANTLADRLRIALNPRQLHAP